MQNTYGQLTVLSEIIERKTSKHRFFLCKCSCNKETIVSMNHLKTGHTTSCGCVGRNRLAIFNYKHGHAKVGRITTEYRIWLNMKNRCGNPANPAYKYYGQRGIKVCQRWQDSFEAFLEDVGNRPSKKLSLDRIDNNDDYMPKNVRWATWSQQRFNSRKPTKIRVPS